MLEFLELDYIKPSFISSRGNEELSTSKFSKDV